MKEIKKGDWISVKCEGEGNVYYEDGCVVGVDEEEVMMFDGKEGWSVDREEIVEVSWK